MSIGIAVIGTLAAVGVAVLIWLSGIKVGAEQMLKMLDTTAKHGLAPDDYAVVERLLYTVRTRK